MAHKLDVFISYAHIDNQPLLASAQGWVAVFHEALAQLLSRFKGANASIWRDPKLDGNTVLWREIEERIADTAALVTVLTPRYVNSPSCAEEIEGFCRAAERNGGLVVDNASRVFKVLKTPIDDANALPPVVGQMLGYEFFRLDDDKTPQELDPLFGESAREEFLRKVNKVAWDIKRLLDRLKDVPAPRQARPLVYLAECSRDRRDARDKLDGELKRLGFTVLPDRQLPTDEAEYVEAVRDMLAGSDFSIHLIGSNYGSIPDGPSQKSIVALQNELAAARFGAAELRRAIWLPHDESAAVAPNQQAFIDALHRDASAQAGADLLTGDIEALKIAIFAHLQRIEAERAARLAPVAPVPAGMPARNKVYLVCDARDRAELVPLIKALRAHRLQVELPVFSGDATPLREANRDLAAAADVLLVYYGGGDEAWKYHQVSELRKARALDATAAAPLQFIYLASPATDDKTMLRQLGDASVIDGLDGFLEDRLAPFFAALAQAGIGT